MEEPVQEDMKEKIIDAFKSCEKCHLCNTVCPVLDIRVSQGPYGINRAIYYAFKWGMFNDHLRDLVYSCSTCGKCVAKCRSVSRELPLVEIFEKAREYLLVEKMLGPMPQQTNALKNMHIRGNPWGNSPEERTKWSEGMGISLATNENEMDVLYFVGCASSYDAQGQKIAKNLSRLLQKAGIKFAISKKETCSGHEARRMGESGLFQYLAETNIEMFESIAANQILTGDPHSYYTFSKEYPRQDSERKFYHSTQFLNNLIDEGNLILSKKVNAKVTYHDPCYLGRHSGVFEEPRKLITRITGIHFIEMERSKEDSECCGMGGGRMWMEPGNGFLSSQAIAEKRVRQAMETGAEILVTGCPFCNITLTDAVKSLKKEERLKVMDITELVFLAI